MQICQSVTAKTQSGICLEITILEEGKKFSVLMSNAAFPANTVFDSAEEAVEASIMALNGNHANDPIVSLYSKPIEEFISNEKMASILS